MNEISEEDEKELEDTKTKNWMKFTDKHSSFFYILQESSNLLAKETEAEGDKE